METRHREPVSVPDGEYIGKQSGYVLSWMHEGREVDVHLSVGVRGIRVPMRFVVKDNKVVESSVEPIDRADAFGESVYERLDHLDQIRAIRAWCKTRAGK